MIGRRRCGSGRRWCRRGGRAGCRSRCRRTGGALVSTGGEKCHGEGSADKGKFGFHGAWSVGLRRFKTSLEAENVAARRWAQLAVLADITARRSGSQACWRGGKQPESNRPGNGWRPLPGLKPGRTTGCVCLPNSMSGDSRRACSLRFRLRLSDPVRSTVRLAAPSGHRRRGGYSRCGRNTRGSGSPACARPAQSLERRGPR